MAHPIKLGGKSHRFDLKDITWLSRKMVGMLSRNRRRAVGQSKPQVGFAYLGMIATEPIYRRRAVVEALIASTLLYADQLDSAAALER